MAIDTTQEKLSVLNAGNPWIGPLFDPDATIDLGDKQHVLNLYSGIEADSFELDLLSVEWSVQDSPLDWSVRSRKFELTVQYSPLDWSVRSRKFELTVQSRPLEWKVK